LPVIFRSHGTALKPSGESSQRLAAVLVPHSAVNSEDQSI
jgi:hypothetical protein